MKLNFVFKSSDHLRYENGKHVSGPHGGARRAIKVEPNINGGENYSVTLFNMDGNHPVWQNNIQMSPKQMKVIHHSNDSIVLQGYGNDSFGESFTDYGLTIQLQNDNIDKCILHMFDRGVDIEYLKMEETMRNEPEIEDIARNVISQYESENVTDGRELLIHIYRTVKDNPSILKSIKDFSSLGLVFLIMLDENLSSDVDTLQMISSVSYLCISKAIESDRNNINLYKNRLLLLYSSNESFKYTVLRGLNLIDEESCFGMLSPRAQQAPLHARDAIYKMEIADLEKNPQLYKQIPFFMERKKQLDHMIERQFFMPLKKLKEIVKSGIECHEKILDHLTERVLENEDVDF